MSDKRRFRVGGGGSYEYLNVWSDSERTRGEQTELVVPVPEQKRINQNERRYDRKYPEFVSKEDSEEKTSSDSVWDTKEYYIGEEDRVSKFPTCVFNFRGHQSLLIRLQPDHLIYHFNRVVYR